MDDFSSKPGTPNAYQLIGADANSIVPGKRMLSSSTPTFVESERGLLITGSPGGSYIIGMVLLATLDFMDGKSAAEIVNAPRIHHQYFPDSIAFEKGALTEAEQAALTQRGHKLREMAQQWGNMQAITWDYGTGQVEAAADPRGNGEGHVY
jgi:gamma-glutamyltranspeptidase/glutathione hydrolase